MRRGERASGMTWLKPSGQSGGGGACRRACVRCEQRVSCARCCVSSSRWLVRPILSRVNMFVIMVELPVGLSASQDTTRREGGGKRSKAAWGQMWQMEAGAPRTMTRWRGIRGNGAAGGVVDPCVRRSGFPRGPAGNTLASTARRAVPP